MFWGNRNTLEVFYIPCSLNSSVKKTVVGDQQHNPLVLQCFLFTMALTRDKCK